MDFVRIVDNSKIVVDHSSSEIKGVAFKNASILDRLLSVRELLASKVDTLIEGDDVPRGLNLLRRNVSSLLTRDCPLPTCCLT